MDWGRVPTQGRRRCADCRTWKVSILPLVTFPVSTPVCLSGSSLCSPFLSPSLSLVSPSPLTSVSSLCFPQWCERNDLCRRLQLRDLLVAPLQRLTRYPLLLRNMAKRCQTEDENKGLQAIAEQVDTSICELTTPELTPEILLQPRRNWGDSDTDSLRLCVVVQLMCDSVHSLTVDKLAGGGLIWQPLSAHVIYLLRQVSQ